LTFFVFLIVAALYYGKNRKRHVESGEEFDLKMTDAMNKVLLQSLIKQSLKMNSGNFRTDTDEEFNRRCYAIDESDTDLEFDDSNTLTNTNNNRSGSGEYSNDRRYSRYEMNEDQEPMSVHEEVLVHDLLQSIEKKSMGGGSSSMVSTPAEDSNKLSTVMSTCKTNRTSERSPSSNAGTNDLQQLNVDSLIDDLNRFFLDESSLQNTKKINVIKI
jgi:hypothetical protein